MHVDRDFVSTRSRIGLYGSQLAIRIRARFTAARVVLLSTLIALAFLTAVGQWLDRPRTLASAEVRTNGVHIHHTADEILAGPAILTDVWTAQGTQVGDVPVEIIVEGIPRRTALAIALAGPVNTPVRMRWGGDGKVPPGEDILTLHSADWQIVRLPIFDRENPGISFEFVLPRIDDRFRVSRPFFTDLLHSNDARVVGRAATAGLPLIWIALLATVAAGLIERYQPGFDRSYSALAAFLLLALLGYFVFWAYFATPKLGHIVVVGSGVFAALWLWRNAALATELWCDERWWRVWMALFGVGFVYLGFQHAWAIDARWSWLGGNRYNPGLPSDNWIPEMFAEYLVRGKSPRAVDFDWVSSDRPPLQTGWILLLGPWLRTDPFRFDALCQAMSFWFQLAWLPAVASFFHVLGAGVRKALVLILVVACSGFVVVNSLFVWPKLAAGAFILSAWVFRVADQPSSTRSFAWALCGLGLTLGMLSHGGTAFSILALAPFCLWPTSTLSWRNVLIFLAVGVVFYAPWYAYQRYYQPPGNHLLKWHLAGVVAIDDRGTLQTLRDSYGAKTWNELYEIRRHNFFQVVRDAEWKQLGDFSAGNPQPRRSRDFFHLFRSVGWWNLGLAMLPLAVWLAGRRHPNLSLIVLLTLGWTALTLAIWIALMFEQNGTMIHQGSYVPPLLLIALGVWALHAIHPLVLAVVASPAIAYFFAVYGFAKPTIYETKLVVTGIGVAVCGAIALWIATRAQSRLPVSISAD